MKAVIIPMLVLMSSTALAEPSMMELWRDKANSHSFSDERYQQQYSPAQRQAFIDQRNAQIAHRNNAEMAKKNDHANQMQQYYSSERASRQFIDETRRYNAPPMQPIISPQLGQYYPNNHLYIPSTQTEQLNIDRARQAQAIQQQADANYETWRQQQNSRKDTEGFASFGK